ncbi:MAG: hypothetical protein Q8R02_21135 [Hyphomonadaceae bacterium]|nr:hypothetical protein [Hyphomonadaceae bacterium]
MRGRGVGRWRWLTAPFSPRGLSGFALLGFFLLSVLATGLGFADLRAANTDAGQLSVAELAITGATTLFVVSAMVVALHHLVAGERTAWWVRGVSFVFYLLFAVWTIGFGYGFFWKELAGQEFTERQFEGVITNLSGSIARTSAALETSERATGEAAQLAAQRAETEASEGRTCANHPASTPGEGPLMRSRFGFADRARNLGDEVRANWIAPVAGQRERLQRQVDALVKRAPPAASLKLDASERAMLEKLAAASRLPSAERRTLFTSVHEEARVFASTANDLRTLHAGAFADRLAQLAAEVGPDPARPGSPDPSRTGDPGYCWDVVLNEKLLAAAAQLRAVDSVAAPEFDFLEGPKATRAAFFGLIEWLAGMFGIEMEGETDFVFDDKAFLALFASIAVDLGIVFLTIVRDTRPRRPRSGKAAEGQGQPTPPRLSTILER